MHDTSKISMIDPFDSTEMLSETVLPSQSPLISSKLCCAKAHVTAESVTL